MEWYNINAMRVSGNRIGIDGVWYNEGKERIFTDIIDYELTQNRTSSYWNNLFENLFKLNKIPFSNNLILDNPDKHFSSWSIEILENIFLTLDMEKSEIHLKQNSEFLFTKRWNEFNGAEFYKLINKLNFRF